MFFVQDLAQGDSSACESEEEEDNVAPKAELQPQQLEECKSEHFWEGGIICSLCAYPDASSQNCSSQSTMMGLANCPMMRSSWH